MPRFFEWFFAALCVYLFAMGVVGIKTYRFQPLSSKYFIMGLVLSLGALGASVFLYAVGLLLNNLLPWQQTHTVTFVTSSALWLSLFLSDVLRARRKREFATRSVANIGGILFSLELIVVLIAVSL